MKGRYWDRNRRRTDRRLLEQENEVDKAAMLFVLIVVVVSALFIGFLIVWL